MLVLEEADRIKQIAAQGGNQLVGPFRLGVIATHPLYEEVFKLVLPVGHSWASRKSVDFRKLGGEKVILPHAGHCFHMQVLESCPELSRSDREGMQRKEYRGIIFPCNLTALAAERRTGIRFD